jgi:hypothetical protein
MLVWKFTGATLFGHVVRHSETKKKSIASPKIKLINQETSYILNYSWRPNISMFHSTGLNEQVSLFCHNYFNLGLLTDLIVEVSEIF